MKTGPLAKRYARALFSTASAREAIDLVAEEIAVIAETFAEQTQLAGMLYSPLIERAKLKLVIDELCNENVSDVTHQFLIVLVGKGRLQLLPAIVHEFELLRDKALGRARVKAISAVPISTEVEKAIRDVLTKTLNSDVRLETTVDPTILGGLVVSIDGKVVDASLQWQLARLKDKLSE